MVCDNAEYCSFTVDDETHCLPCLKDSVQLAKSVLNKQKDEFDYLSKRLADRLEKIENGTSSEEEA
jgi:hypothetical protein